MTELRATDWTDIEAASLDDPFLYAAVTLVRRGVSREEALMAAALALSKTRAVFHEQLTTALQRCSCGAAAAAIRLVGT
jgi:hypothetical protein